MGHRTSEELPGEADIVIVGSGITGTAAARYLAEDKRADGKSIILLEAREACWGATGRVSPSYQVVVFPFFSMILYTPGLEVEEP